MCTILIAHQVWSDQPLVLAANRDERLARPAQAPAWRRFGGGDEIFAPLDLEAGGTWMGLGSEGLVVAITNRASQPPDPKRRSRGWLVAEALGAGTLAAARAWSQSVDVSAYNPFHLVVADRDGGFVMWNREDQWARYDLEPGLHVITERYAGDAAGEGAQAQPTRRPALARRLLAPELASSTAPSPGRWREVLGHRASGAEPSAPAKAMEDMTVRIAGADYGTRSASLVQWPIADDPPAFWWSEGPPDRAEFDDRGPELRAGWVGRQLAGKPR